jgi:hypothetical protein
VAGLLAGVGTQRAAAETLILCAAGRPCITELSASSTYNLTARWSGNWDAYNIRWERFSPRRRPSLILAVDVGGAHLSTLTVPRGYEFDTYRFSVQGCNRRVLGSSECSPWSKRRSSRRSRMARTPDRVRLAGGLRGRQDLRASRSRDEAASDNAQAATATCPAAPPARTGSSGGGPRGDVVCVTPAVRTQPSPRTTWRTAAASTRSSRADPAGDPAAPGSASEASNVRGQYIRHRFTLGEITPVISDLDMKDATWVMRPALSGTPGAVSFEASNYPGTFLRHQAFRIKQHRNDNSDLFKKDASFHVHPGLSGLPGTVSFEAVNVPGHYIRHQNDQLWLANRDAGNKALFASDATFRQGGPGFRPNDREVSLKR